MKLFSEYEELKSVVGAAHTNNSLESISPFITAAIESHITPILGTEPLTLIEKFIEEGLPEDSSEEEENFFNKALTYLRQAAGNLAYLEMAKDGGVQIDDSGFHRIDNPETKQAYQWQMFDFKRARESQGYIAIRNLYLWLEKNISLETLEPYKNSSQRKYLRTFFIPTDTDFNRFIQISGFETWWSLRNWIELTQEETIKLIITSGVFTSLQSLLLNGPTENETPDLQLLYLCQKVVASGTIEKAAPFLPFKIHNSGLLLSEFISTRENSAQQTQAADHIQRIVLAARNMFARAKSDLENYLYEKSSPETYPTFYQNVVQKRIQENKTQQELQDRNKTSKIVRL